MHAFRVVGVSIGAAALTMLTVATGLTSMARSSRPDVALRFSPWDAKAREERADQAMATGLTGQNLAAAERDARAALRRSPLSPVATRVLGFTNDIGGKHEVARRLILQAAMLSRRDLGTRIWLIEDAVSRGDVGGALDQFDIALRRSRNARELLFPILAHAAVEKQILGPLTAILKKRPNWTGEFLQFAIAQGTATEDMAFILAQMPDLQFNEGDARQQAISQLVKEKKFAAARRASNWYSKQNWSGNLRDPSFKGGFGYKPFTWTLESEASRGADLDNGLQFFSEGGDGGIVARQLLTLTPGKYRLFVVGRTGDTNDGSATWSIRCGDADGKMIAQAKVPQQLGSVTADFDVAPDCRGQFLSMYVSGGTGAAGVKGQVKMIDVIDR